MRFDPTNPIHARAQLAWFVFLGALIATAGIIVIAVIGMLIL